MVSGTIQKLTEPFLSYFINKSSSSNSSELLGTELPKLLIPIILAIYMTLFRNLIPV